MEAAIIVALIGAGSASLVAGWTFLSTRANQLDNERTKQRNAKELAQLNAQLQSIQAIGTARLAYEYDARKRLYEETGPLIFQLIGACDSAYIRVLDLARSARDGNLTGTSSWLDAGKEDYFLLSTVHRLAVPLAIIRLWHQRLTLVDLTLDRLIGYRYVLGRQLMLSLSEDFFLAAAGSPITYDPDRDGSQGLYIGVVEKAVDALLVGGDSEPRVLNFGEFESACRVAGGDTWKSVSPLVELLTDFHPERRPITWRIFLLQAHLHRAILRSKRSAVDESQLPALDSLRIPLPERADFDWRIPAERGRIADGEVLTVPFDAVTSFLIPAVQHDLELYEGL